MKEEDVEIKYNIDAATGKHDVTNDAIMKYMVDNKLDMCSCSCGCTIIKKK